MTHSTAAGQRGAWNTATMTADIEVQIIGEIYAGRNG
jgi:hypothetical protein